jgi:ATP-dependent Lon protease
MDKLGAGDIRRARGSNAFVRGAEGDGASGASFDSGSSTGGIMVSAGHPSSHPQVLAVPLPRRPLMPGIIMPVKITDEKLIAELEDMRNRGTGVRGGVLTA